MTHEPNRPLVAAAGLCGALGVAVAAAASHKADPNLAIAGNFLLLHAPALIGLSLIAANRLAAIAGWILVVALILFVGDLASLSQLGHSLFPLAAPIGGTGLIVGWLLVIAAALFGGRRAADK
jgi:uncharacterized membrane protein YgdD (TMEM256/DUF423 family)